MGKAGVGVGASVRLVVSEISPDGDTDAEGFLGPCHQRASIQRHQSGSLANQIALGGKFIKKLEMRLVGLLFISPPFNLVPLHDLSVRYRQR